MKSYILIFLLSIFTCVDTKENAKEDVTLSGGLAIAQTRLLTLTGRMKSIEDQVMNLLNEKLILTKDINLIKRKEEISEKEKKLDIKINQLNSELETTKTMIEHIKEIINKNNEKGFKIFGN